MTPEPAPSAASRVLDIMTLVALAVAYPLFSVVSQSPEFFVARNSTLGNVAAMLASICVVLPLLIAALAFVAHRFDARLGTAVHYAAFGLLSTALFLPWIKRLDVIGPLPTLGLALLLGSVAAIGHHRSATVRSYVSVLAVSIVIVPALFVWGPAVRDAFARVDVALDAPEISETPPIVFVVLDEFLRELQPPHPETAVKFLQSVARYRAEHPYSSSEPAGDQNVARILGKYATQ